MSDHPLFRMRRARAMTQSRLAEACGVSVRTIRRAEQGSLLSDETVLALCAVLGCSRADLAPTEVVEGPVTPPSSLSGSVLGATALGVMLAVLVAVASTARLMSATVTPSGGEAHRTPTRAASRRVSMASPASETPQSHACDPGCFWMGGMDVLRTC